MKAYKCDICGNCFVKFKKLKLPKKKVSIKPIAIYVFQRTKPCDICPDCISAIQRVIDERSKENENRR